MGRAAALTAARGRPRLRELVLVAATLGAGPALVGAVACAQDAPPEADAGTGTAAAQDTPRPPGRRRAIAGLGGFVSRSKLVYAVLPDSPFRLEATYVSPVRGRWLVPRGREDTPEDPGAAEADRRQRSHRFQYGEAIWSIEPGRVASRAFSGEERRLARLQMELRRVATTWPAGLEWTEADGARRATLEGLGVLVATLGEDGLPTAIESRDADGRLRERLADIAWHPATEEGARRWPARWEFYLAKKHIWSETIESVTPAGKVSELVFLPPDRRGPGARVSLPPGATQRVEVPAHAAWSEPLDEEARDAWPRALAAGRDALARWEAELGADRLEARPVFRLDAEGRPTHVELRLRSLPEALPKGWRRVGASTALRRILPGLEGVDAAALRALTAGLGEDERAGAAYLVVQLVGDGAGLTQLHVPALRRP